VITMLATLAVAISAAAPPPTEPIPDGYMPLVDDTGSIVIAVPDTWIDVDTAPAVNDDGSLRPYIAASPDIESFLASFDTPGAVYAAFPFTTDLMALVADYGLQSGCETLEINLYDDPVFVGIVQVGTNCGPAGMTWNLVVASPADHSFTALMQLQTGNPDELRTLLLTFNYAQPN
jgi:hypothetical protein